jgi:hypothetical protein
VKQKTILAGLLVSTVAAEAVAQTLHKVHPHVELETKVATPRTITRISTGGGSMSTKPLGHFRWETFYAKRGLARKAKDELAMYTAYVETAREIVKHYPDLKLWERQHQYNCFKSEMDLTKMRTRGCRDFSGALPAIAQILGVPGAALPSLQDCYKNPKHARTS